MAESTVEERRARYERVLGIATQLEKFSAVEIQREAFETRPTFVTRILNQLTSEGVLQEIFDGSQSQYRWKRGPSEFSIDGWIDRQFCGKQITQTPLAERPRERLLRCGAENLRTAELLAILIRTGQKGESALESGERIANRAGDRLDVLRSWSAAEYKEVSRSLAKRHSAKSWLVSNWDAAFPTRCEPIASHRSRSTPAAWLLNIANECSHVLAADRRQEEFHIVTLDTKLFPIRTHQITVGTLDASLVHPREVFRAAIRDAASSILLVHNHPSGDPTPSREDYEVIPNIRNRWQDCRHQRHRPYRRCRYDRSFDRTTAGALSCVAG